MKFNLLNFLELKYVVKTRKDSKNLIKKEKKENDLKLLIEEINSIDKKAKSLDVYLNTHYYENFLKDLNDEVLRKRKDVLHKNMGIYKDNVDYSYYKKDEEIKIFDVYSVIGSLPRVNLKQIKDLALKLNYLILEESVFTKRKDKEEIPVLNELSDKLKSLGYKIYYLSPVTLFNFHDYIRKLNFNERINNVYVGNYEAVFNTLKIVSSVFAHIYNEIDRLNNQDHKLLELLKKEEEKIENLRKDFESFATSISPILKAVSTDMNFDIKYVNDHKIEQYKKRLREVRNHNHFIENGGVIEKKYYYYYDERTGEIGSSDYLYDKHMERFEFMDRPPSPRISADYITIERRYLIPEPAMPQLIDLLEFEPYVKSKQDKLAISFEPTKAERVLMQEEIVGNYLMFALKEDLNSCEGEQDDAIIMSVAGELNKNTIEVLNLELTEMFPNKERGQNERNK